MQEIEMTAARLKMPKQWCDGSGNGMLGGGDDGVGMMNLWENEL